MRQGSIASPAVSMAKRRDYQLLRRDDFVALRGVQGEPGGEWSAAWEEEAIECALFQYVLLVEVAGGGVRAGEACKVDKEGALLDLVR